MKYLISFLLLCLGQSLQAQDVLQKPDILPGSPEAAAFAKNVNIPVSYASGTPQISIPFYTVKSGSLEIPVAISYNASGIREEETPTWVGLGWSLSAGGQISRSVRGSADERAVYGYMNVFNNRKVKYIDTAHCRCPNGGTQTWAIENDIIAHQLDMEPDQFSFSILGYSGDFFFNQDSGRYQLVPYQNILVEGSPGAFVLTLPNGVKAYFGECSTCEETLLSGFTTSFVDGISYAPEPIADAPYGNTWMVRTIIEPTGRHIDFNYQSEWILGFGRGGERFGSALSDPTNKMRRQSFYRQYIKKPVLQSIVGDNVNIYFNRSLTARQDIPDYMGGSRSLDTILVTTKSGLEVRSFLLEYGYFNSPLYPAASLLDIGAFTAYASKRLYLKSVTEKKGSKALPPYRFHYNELSLPSRLSTSQDYWGYYNGRNNGTNLMPNIPALAFYPWAPTYNEIHRILPDYAAFVNLGGADRRIDSAFSQAGILKKIEYPTGGVTEYYYEQNTASVGQLNIHGGMVPPDMIDRSYSLGSMTNPIPAQPPYPTTYTGQFSLNMPVTKVKFIPQLSGCSISPSPSCKFSIVLRSLQTGQAIATFNTNNILQYQLPAGNYQLEVSVNTSSQEYPPLFRIDVQWGDRNDLKNFLAGGLRVKKIISRDGVGGTISRSFKYHYDSSQVSSGIMEGCPSYKVHDFNAEMNPIRQYYVSNSVLPLSSDGKTVRYEYVSEFYDSTASSFKNSYAFTSGITEPLNFGRGMSGAPRLSWSWQNSLLKRKQVFEKLANGSFRIVAEEENFFKAHKPFLDLVGLYGPQIIPYKMTTEWHLPDSSTSFVYSYENGIRKTLASGIKHFYNPQFLPSGNSATNTRGEVIHNKIWYPTDYNNVSGFNIPGLYERRIWNIPVRQETSLNGKLLAGTVIKYNINGQPVQGYAYENNFSADTVAHNRNTILTAQYQLRSGISYDQYHRIHQVNNYKEGNSVYIWDFATGNNGPSVNEVPVAVVANAENSQVAYSSFENAGKGNWNYTAIPIQTATVMGKKAYNLSSGNITKASLPAGTYLVSYWSTAPKSVNGTVPVRNGLAKNGWQLYEHRLVNPGTITISGSGLIDELRLHPENARMSSYDYNEFLLVRTVCDVNGRMISYEYDLLNRLSIVRDHYGNIQKKHCYNYAGQEEDCGLGTEAHWQLVQSVCEQVNGVNTGKLLKQEKDTNPRSSTYNQTRSIVVANAPECGATSSSCTGPDKKMINNICETGLKIYTGSAKVNKTTWVCYFHYRWSDNSVSQGYEETTTGPCPF